jgi:hypothetical protein
VRSSEFEIGWCHQCGTVQLLVDAPWLRTDLGIPSDSPEAPEPCCVVCREDEPWDLAVFPMPESMRRCAEERHETWAPVPCEVCGAGSREEVRPR